MPLLKTLALRNKSNTFKWDIRSALALTNALLTKEVSLLTPTGDGLTTLMATKTAILVMLGTLLFAQMRLPALRSAL
jgi:hypothetical protein